MPAANTVYLSNPVVTLGASTSITGYCTSARLVRKVTAADTTVFGQTARTYQGTLEDNELTLTLYLSYGASPEVYAALKDIVGTQSNVSVAPAAGTASATNPKFTLTNAYLEELPVLDAKLGEMSQIDITFKGGSYAAATA
ncbi:MAG: hypothetical protein ACR2IJ_01265 [Fluviibacter sp.]